MPLVSSLLPVMHRQCCIGEDSHDVDYDSNDDSNEDDDDDHDDDDDKDDDDDDDDELHYQISSMESSHMHGNLTSVLQMLLELQRGKDSMINATATTTTTSTTTTTTTFKIVRVLEDCYLYMLRVPSSLQLQGDESISPLCDLFSNDGSQEQTCVHHAHSW